MSETLNLKTISTIDPSPFKHLCVTIGELPSAFVESMSYYELLAWFVNYLENTVIPAVNANGEATAELQEKFIELKDFVDNYFENLDVQEEINNKLDEMAEEGTLQEIITTYIQSNVAWTFDTVADMKAATNLVAGSYAQTLGFYEINDGGGALYYITDAGTANEMDVIAIDSLYANLVITTHMNVKQFGAHGDGETDDANYLVECFSKASNVDFIEGETYLCSEDIIVHNSGVINLNGASITMYNRLAEGENNIAIFALNGNFIEIKNGELIGDIDERVNPENERCYGVRAYNCNTIEIHNLKIHKFVGAGINMRGVANANVHDNEVYDNGRNNVTLLYGDDVTLHDMYIHDCRGVANPGHGIDIEPYESGQSVKGLDIYNIHTKNNYGSGINVSFYYNSEATAIVRDCYVEDRMTVKLSNVSNGSVDVRNIICTKELVIEDPVSETMEVTVKNLTIRNFVPTTTTSYWGSAVRIQNAIRYTGDIQNVNIDGLTVEGGSPTRCITLADGNTGGNKSIRNVYNKVSGIDILRGSDWSKWNLYNFHTSLVPDISSAINAQHAAPVINLTGSNATIQAGFPYRSKIKVINATSGNKTITSQGNNQLGLTTFLVPAGSECYITVNADGTIEIDYSKIAITLLASTSYSINLHDVNFLKASRSSHYNIYYVDYGTIIELAKDGTSGTGISTSVSAGVLSISDVDNNTLLYLMR